MITIIGQPASETGRFSKKPDDKVFPLGIKMKTSSCGMFLRIYPKKHEARSAVIDLSLGSSKNVFENLFEKACSTKCGNRL